MQLQLSGTGNNHLELAITIMQHLNQGRTPKSNPQVRPEHTTTVKNRKEASNTIKNHQEPNRTCQNNAKAASTILKSEDLTKDGHNQLAASKSQQNSKN